MIQGHRNVANTLRAELTALKSVSEDDARTMPPAFYTSEEFHELEREHIFRKEWICIGHAGEISNPGDFFTTDLVDEQLIVVHGRDGQIRVMSNVCRHRGNIIAEGKGNGKKFTCRYHGWTFATDGRLVAAPFMEEKKNFDKKSCSLPVFPTEVWNGFIFVNLDLDATPLADRLTGLGADIANYHAGERNLLFSADEVWNTNWKNLTENFMEGYHLSATHLKSLHDVTPTALCKKVQGDAHFTAYRSYFPENYPERGPYHPDLTDDEKRNTYLFCPYPSFVCAVAPNFTFYLCLRPLGVGQVGVRWGVAGFHDNPDIEEVKTYVDLIHLVNREDREKLETLQTALKTRHYHHGPLAPADYEGTIWDFLNYMADRLGEDVDLNSHAQAAE
jgi:choline monooxygenase